MVVTPFITPNIIVLSRYLRYLYNYSTNMVRVLVVVNVVVIAEYHLVIAQFYIHYNQSNNSITLH